MSEVLGIWNDHAHERKETVLAKLGGKDVLHKAVDLFYDKILADPEVSPFFRHTNMSILKWHQLNLMTVAFGENDDFEVDMLILQRHKQLFDDGLTLSHFDLFVSHFVESLNDLKVQDAVVQEAKAVLDRLRPAFAQGHEEAAKRLELQRQKNLLISSIIIVAGIIIFRLAKRKV